MKQACFYFLILTELLFDGCTEDDITSRCYVTSIGLSTYIYDYNKYVGGHDNYGAFTLTYDNQGRPFCSTYQQGYVFTNVYNSDGSVTTNQTYNGSKYGKINTFYNSTNQIVQQKIYYYYVSAADSIQITYQYPNTTTHNISTMISMEYSIAPQKYVSTYQYDTKVNPTSFIQSLSPWDLTENNVTKSSRTPYDNNDVPLTANTTTSTNQYTYTSEGYPLTLTSTHFNDGSEVGITRTNYAYSNCQ